MQPLTTEYHKNISVGDVVASRIYNKRRGEKGIVIANNKIQYDYFKILVVEYADGKRERYSQKDLVLFKDFDTYKAYI